LGDQERLVPTVTLGRIRIAIEASVPLIRESCIERCEVSESFDGSRTDLDYLMVTVAIESDWPQLVVEQRYEPGPRSAFDPGVCLIPETSVLLIGAGTRVLAYDLIGLQRLREDRVNCGFWSWRQHGDVVLCLAELELAAWSLEGHKLWSTHVEPPWDYTVHDVILNLDVMGERSSFDLRTGPRL
jgi:hypothetical protein